MKGRPDARDLAVVIPTRDRWDILARTLDALRAQTVRGFQTVVVVDGKDQQIPDLGTVTVFPIEKGGPGAARNAGVAHGNAPLILFLGDDTIPAPDLVERHLDRHGTEPDDRVAVLGDISWHPDVADSRLHRWLDWSATQFDYHRLRRDLPDDAGYGRFIASNTSLKRALFEAAGGFDETFSYYCEDLDLGYRLAESGMVLRYEPRAAADHLHAYRWADLERRFAGIAPAERMMAAKHRDWATYFQPRLEAAAARPPVSPWWARLVDRVPDTGGAVRGRFEENATLWYHQRLAGAYFEAWELDEERQEWAQFIVAARIEDPAKGRSLADRAGGRRHREQLDHLLGPGGRLLVYECGGGADGLRLLAGGHDVSFFTSEPLAHRYLLWRLERRCVQAPIYGDHEELRAGFDIVCCFGRLEDEPDPSSLLEILEAQAPLVVVDVGAEGVGRLLRHAKHRGLVLYRTLGDTHLVAYRSLASHHDSSGASRLTSEIELAAGRALRRWPALGRLKRSVA